MSRRPPPPSASWGPGPATCSPGSRRPTSRTRRSRSAPRRRSTSGTAWRARVEAGGDVGLRHAGYHALDSLRMEKAYRAWGHDLTSEDTPLEAGLTFAVAFDKPGGFIGPEALQRQRERPPGRRPLVFTLVDHSRLLFGS